MDYADDVIRSVYGGDRTAWQRAKPVALLERRKGEFAGVWAVVSTGQFDTGFGPGSKTLAATMKGAGMDTTILTIPGVAHVGDNLPHAQRAIYPLLFARLGLAPPS